MLKGRYYGEYANTMGVKQGQEISLTGPFVGDKVNPLYYIYRDKHNDEYCVFPEEISNLRKE